MKSSKMNISIGFKCNVCGQVKAENQFYKNYPGICRSCFLRKNAPNRKFISEEIKQAIIQEFAAGAKPKDLAKKYNLCDTTVYNKILKTGHTKATRERNNEIRSLFEKGAPIAVLMEKFGLPEKRIEGIVKT